MPAVSLERLGPGDWVAGYEIVRHVKSGGMASLYLARRRGAAGFRKAVAVKVVHPDLAAEPRFVQMFLNEAQLAAQIAHPNVVHTEELLEESGSYVMVMEYVHGCNLAMLLAELASQNRRLAPDLSAWIAMQIADGLHAAHELRDEQGQPLGVVHRDVSPQNILISWDGHVKLIDFGIAKSRMAHEQTRVGVIRGKIAYMSPEQARARTVDRRTDVYAAGIILWEMLTSRRLFRSDGETELLDLVRTPQVRPPSRFAPVEPQLEAAVLGALEPVRDERTPTAKALRDELMRARPQAASIHSSDLAQLLGAIFGDEIGPLWEGAEPPKAPPPQRVHQTMAHLTSPAPAPAYGAAPRTPSVSRITAITQRTQVPQGFEAPPPTVEEFIELPPDQAPDRLGTFAPPPKSGSGRAMVAMLLVAAALAAGLYWLGLQVL